MIQLLRRRTGTSMDQAEQRAKVVIRLATYNGISLDQAAHIIDQALNQHPARRRHRLRLPSRRNH